MRLQRAAQPRYICVVSEPINVRYVGVTKAFENGGQQTVVLSGVTFDVAPGDYVALMGPSGSGKSTLLNLTGGIDKPTGGHVYVGNVEPATMSDDQLCDWRARNLGFIFQRYHLIDVLTAAENVEVPLLMFGVSKAERKRRVMSALELVGLADRANHTPKMLSGGQEQRVAIARAFVADPSIILADEPTGDLDTNSAEEILGLLDMLNQMGKTLLVVTHDPNAARRAKRTMYLQKGQFSEIAV
jgi:putative ABC transport system ATP-binding protein